VLKESLEGGHKP